MEQPSKKTGFLGGGERSPERINAEQWNSVLLQRNGTLLQSWEWAAFQQQYGRQATFLAMSEDTFTWNMAAQETNARREQAWHDLDLQAVVFEHRLPMGLTYLYIPRGPVIAGNIDSTHEELFARFYAHVQQVAKSRGTAFIRIEPSFPPALAPHATKHLLEMGFMHMRTTIQPRQNLVINLEEPETVLQRMMHQKTRYNINLAGRRGVSVRFGSNEDDTRNFIGLIEDTSNRQNIRMHPKAYYRHMIDAIPALNENESLLAVGARHRLYFAEYKGEPIATAFVAYFGNRATYLHGGSSVKYRNVMAPHALHWRIMQDAKSLGYTEYDMGGIDDARWPGITRFKRGFAGWVEEFPGLYEMPLSQTKYLLYRALKKIKR